MESSCCPLAPAYWHESAAEGLCINEYAGQQVHTSSCILVWEKIQKWPSRYFFPIWITDSHQTLIVEPGKQGMHTGLVRLVGFTYTQDGQYQPGLCINSEQHVLRNVLRHAFLLARGGRCWQQTSLRWCKQAYCMICLFLLATGGRHGG